MTENRFLLICLTAWSMASVAVTAFVAPTPRSTRQRATASSTTELALGIPKFLLPDEEDKGEDDKASAGTTPQDEKKVGMKGLLQLITAGAGAPFLGDFEGVEEETGKFMFSLEANNLVDEEGNSKQTSMPYFESGWVDESDTGFTWPWEKKKKDA